MYVHSHLLFRNTGTPIQNNTQELWTLLHYLNPEQFASLDDFLEEFRDLKDASQVASLHAILKPYLVRGVFVDACEYQFISFCKLVLRVLSFLFVSISYSLSFLFFVFTHSSPSASSYEGARGEEHCAQGGDDHRGGAHHHSEEVLPRNFREKFQRAQGWNERYEKHCKSVSSVALFVLFFCSLCLLSRLSQARMFRVFSTS